MQSRHVAEAIIWGSKFHQWLYTLRIEEAKQIILRNPGVICAVLKLQKNLKTFCKIIVRCGENVGKILYKNGLQVSVGHLRVPGAGIEPARIAPLVFETSASTDSAIRAGVLFQLPVDVGLRWQGGMLGHPGCFLSGRFDQG